MVGPYIGIHINVVIGHSIFMHESEWIVIDHVNLISIENTMCDNYNRNGVAIPTTMLYDPQHGHDRHIGFHRTGSHGGSDGKGPLREAACRDQEGPAV